MFKIRSKGEEKFPSVRKVSIILAQDVKFTGIYGRGAVRTPVPPLENFNS